MTIGPSTTRSWPHFDASSKRRLRAHVGRSLTRSGSFFEAGHKHQRPIRRPWVESDRSDIVEATFDIIAII